MVAGMIGRIAALLVGGFAVWLGLTIMIDPAMMVPSATMQRGEPGTAPQSVLAFVMRLVSGGLLIFFAAAIIRAVWRTPRPSASIGLPGKEKGDDPV
jgi:hypothetical protein